MSTASKAQTHGLESLVTPALKPALQSLLKDHSFETLRCAFIRYCAEANGIPFAVLKKSPRIAPLLDEVDEPTSVKIEAFLKTSKFDISIKGLESVFENLIDSTRRKSQGAVYTPNFVIDYLLQSCLQLCSPKGHPPTICDPACGSAGFLIRAAELVERAFGVPVQRSFREFLVGIDNDVVAIQNAGILVDLYMAYRGNDFIPQLNLYNQDSLLLSPAEIWRHTNCPSGFDVITTNPPYVKLQNIEPRYREALISKYAGVATGNFSLSILFLVASHKLLAPGGCLGMITQNNLFTSLAGRQVRRYLQSHKAVRRIIDFGHQKIFERASAYTCLIFLGTHPAESFEFGSVRHQANSDELGVGLLTPIRYENLNPEKWRLAKSSHIDQINRIESAGKPLGEIASIRVGFATLRDSVFLVHEKNQECLATISKDNVVSIEMEATRPAVKVAEIRNQSDLMQNTRRVIFPYERSSGKYKLIDERDLKRRYPRVFEYLLQCRPKLETRDRGNRKYDDWFAWGRTQGMDAFGPKLLTKTFSRGPQFLIDKTDQLFCNGYGVFLKKVPLFENSLPIEVLSLLLNSKVMHYYQKLTSFQIEGDYQCYQKNFIERFGVIDLNSNQIKTLVTLSTHEVDEYFFELYRLNPATVNEVINPSVHAVS